jgi:hypothetical protein
MNEVTQREKDWMKGDATSGGSDHNKSLFWGILGSTEKGAIPGSADP